MIEIQNVAMRFGGLTAIDHISFSIPPGRITGLIGPNGAGKTTLFNVIAGSLSPSRGAVYLDGEDITPLAPHERFARGLLRTFQIAQEFSTLTVLENLLMVAPEQPGERLMDAWFRPGKVAAHEAEIRTRAFEVLDFLRLTELAQEPAGNLSGGQKKLLELGRTLMTEAKVVLLDEIGAGVNRTLLGELGDRIIELNQTRGTTFCLIEHDLEFVTRLCDPVIVMAEGALLAQGTADQVLTDEAVVEAYLGSTEPGQAEAS